MTIDQLLKDDPKFHMHDGSAHSWRLRDEPLRYIDEVIHSESCTLETGAGVSTVLFAMKGAKHISITPKSEEVDKISDYCRLRNISLDRITFLIDKSEKVLPGLSPDHQLDFILIDGDHKFPVPFIDWYYSADFLKIGGLLMIDDLQQWTGYSLRDFLSEEPEWELVRSFRRSEETFDMTAVFRKLKTGSTSKWWGEQPFIVKSDLRSV